MTPLSPHRRLPELALLLGLALLCAGCAGIPRIDPSGQRLLVWPNSQAAAASPSATGNYQAPAVPAAGSGSGCSLCPFCPGSCFRGSSLCPGACLAGCPCLKCPCDWFKGDDTPPPPSLPVLPPQYLAPAAATAATQPEERLTITPSRLLAPVGSEVILKAGVCNRDGYLRTNRRIEWMLGREGTGQFVTVGEQGEMDILRAPWQRPNKHDNAYAVGYTSPFHTCLRRGTDDTSDDLQVRPGEAWITVSSASEGVSYVTAHAPESDNWNARRTVATVYWVDAQWKLPPPATAQPGQAQTLTTTVTRQSDGAPIAGWVVRYKVADGGTARLGYEAGDAAEATTDAKGQASIQVTPTDDQPGSARITVQVVRPAQSAPMPSPQLELGGGETFISWSTGAIPSTGPPVRPGNPAPPADNRPPTPFEPPPSGGGDPIGPPATARAPRIEVVLRRDTSGPIRVGDSIPVTVTLLNTGDATAERILLVDDFDRGLSNAMDLMGTYRINNPAVPDLPPGESAVIDIDFSAVLPGEHCHAVTVTTDGAQPVTERQCFDIEAAAPPAEPRLRIEVASDAIREVGDTYSYLATVYNDGDAPAEAVNIDVVSTPELEAAQATGSQTAIQRGVNWKLPRIERGGSYPLEVQFRCLTATQEAKVTIFAKANGVNETDKTIKIEIRPGRATPPPAPPAAASLSGVLSSSANPTRAGDSAVLSVAITNTTGAPLSQIEFRLMFPQQIQPNLSAGASPLNFRRTAEGLEFAAVPSLAAGETFRLAVPYNAAGQGLAQVVLQMRAAGAPALVTATTTIDVRSR